MSDIMDRIALLVDEQMAEGDTGELDVGNRECPHCGRDWHGLAITEALEEQRRRGVVDPYYRYNHDVSAVLCPGSTAPAPEGLVRRVMWCGCPEGAHRDYAEAGVQWVQDVGYTIADIEAMQFPSRYREEMLRSREDAPWMVWYGPRTVRWALAQLLARESPPLWTLPEDVFDAAAWFPRDIPDFAALYARPHDPVSVGIAQKAWREHTRAGVWRDVVCAARLEPVEQPQQYPPTPAEWRQKWLWGGIALYEPTPEAEPEPERAERVRDTPPMWVDPMRRNTRRRVQGVQP